VARMFQDITNTIYDTLLIFQCYGLGILLSKDSISGRSSICMTFHKRAFVFFLYHYHGLQDMTRDKSLVRPCASAKSL
jgi:hypothetical protein